MAITTTQTLNGLKQTVTVCDRCREHSGLLMGSMDRMVCSPCADADYEERAARLAATQEAERQAAALKAAQSKERRAARKGT